MADCTSFKGGSVIVQSAVSDTVGSAVTRLYTSNNLPRLLLVLVLHVAQLLGQGLANLLVKFVIKWLHRFPEW